MRHLKKNKFCQLFLSSADPALIQYFSSTLFTLHNILHLICTEFLCPQPVMLDIVSTTLCHFFLRHTKCNPHLRTVWGTSYLYPK